MSFNYDYTRKDGTEVMVCYRVLGYDRIEIEFKPEVYGLPEGENLTDEEWEEIEAAIWANPPSYEPLDDDVF